MTLLQALDPGDHVILPDDIYFGVRKLATGPFARWGLDVSHVDMSNNASLEAAFKPSTRMVWIETPSNPLLTVTDIAAVSKLAHYHHAHVVVDNTWPSPALTRPIEHGADIVLHSVTKYLGGHSDVLGGALIFEKEDDLFHRIVELQRDAGAVLDPFSSWLTLRGMRSLIPRITHQCASALYLANWLNEHSAVEAVHYPGLSSHPGHETAKRQMAAFGGMLSFRVQGGKPAALSIVNSSRLFTNATSLGGTESLMEHRASAEGDTSTTPDNLLRVSLGLESVEDLKADLEQALDRV
ncbi:MAG: PLP-dependent transferase, partial [Bacteroidetes bacterium]|nr:PLP-dependent transferase [Bacteroidota bacterium]